MATSTTNYSFTLPEVGGDTDQWGSQLNANWTLADSTLKTIEDSVVNVTLTGNDYLTISGQVITVGDVDLTADVTGTLPVGSGGTGLAALGSANQVLGVNSGGTALEYKTLSTGGSVTSVAVTGSDGIEVDSGSPVTTSGTIALGINSTSLSTHLGLGSLATQSSVTESQISDLQSYITANSTDTLTNKSGNISQWTNDSGYLTAETNNLSTVSGTLGTANGGTGLTAIGTANQVLAVNSGANALEFQTISITESQISDLGSYQTADAGLTSIAGLTTSADKMVYTTAADTYAVTTLTTAGRALLDDADAAAQRATLGLGSLATQSTITESQISDLQSYLTAEVNDLSAAVTGTLGTANGGTGLTTIGTAGQVLTVNSGANALEYQTPLVVLPITDSAGNNVLSESGGVVTLTADAAVLEGSSSGDLVRITQTGSGNALVVEDSANPDSTPFVVDSSGNVLVGATSAVSNQGVIQAKTSVATGPGAYSASNTNYNSGNYNWTFGMNGVGAFVVYINPTVSGNSGVYLNAGATSWTGNSDERLKDITQNIENAIDSVQSLRAVKYTLKADKAEIKTQRVGLIAQDVQAVLPEIIDVDQDGYLGIRYTEAIPLLVAAIKEQQTIIESQQSEINALTARIEALETV